MNYEAWREALIAFYRAESPWMTGKRDHLKQGGELTDTDKRIIEGLAAVQKVAA